MGFRGAGDPTEKLNGADPRDAGTTDVLKGGQGTFTRRQGDQKASVEGPSSRLDTERPTPKRSTSPRRRGRVEQGPGPTRNLQRSRAINSGSTTGVPGHQRPKEFDDKTEGTLVTVNRHSRRVLRESDIGVTTVVIPETSEVVERGESSHLWVEAGVAIGIRVQGPRAVGQRPTTSFLFLISPDGITL